MTMVQNLDDIKVSYIMASYNHEKYIKKAIDSILNQSHKNIELIVCDDCSTDDTYSFLQKYAKEKGFICFKNDKNMGTAYTTNRLIKAATGEYLGIIGSDDWIKKDKVKEQLAYMVEHSLDAVFSPLIKYYERQNQYIPVNGDDVAKLGTTDKILKRFYETGQGAGLIQCALFRTECAKKIGISQKYKCEDAVFQMRFLQAGYQIGYLNKPLTYYRIHANNLHSDAMYCLNELEIPFIRDFFPKEYRRKLLSAVYADAALKLAMQENIGQSVRLQVQSVRYKFSIHQFREFFKADIRYLMIKTGVYKLYWRIRHHTEWTGY